MPARSEPTSRSRVRTRSPYFSLRSAILANERAAAQRRFSRGASASLFRTKRLSEISFVRRWLVRRIFLEVMDPRDRHLGLHGKLRAKSRTAPPARIPPRSALTNSLGTLGPDEPVRDCAVTSPSAFLRHRRCQRSSRYDDEDVPVQIVGYSLP